MSATDRHELLAADYRRLALDILAEQGSSVHLGDLAAGIAVQETGSDVVDEETVERVAIALHHTHLPKMDELGVLDYDPESHRVDPDGAPVDAERDHRSSER